VTETPAGDWLALGDASRLLGVAPQTLRRWSDAGQVDVFTTPGGHRRYRRSSLERMVAERQAARPSLLRSGLTSGRLVRAYRADASAHAGALPWVLDLDAADRDAFRAQGRQLVTDLLAYLDAPDATIGERHLASMTALAAGYGRMVSGLGLSMSGAVEGFLEFRRPFLGQLSSVAVQRGFDTAATTELMGAAERVMDRLLVAVMSAASIQQVGQARRSRRARPIKALVPPGPAGEPGTGPSVGAGS
jgi:hypothetical protein